MRSVVHRPIRCCRASPITGLLTLLALVGAAANAHAQLPRIQLPNLPGGGLPGTLSDALGRADATAGNLAGRVDQLADARRLRVDALLRTQRASLDRDPSGEPIVRAEVVSFDPSQEALGRARGAGFQVARERVLEGLDSRVVVLRAPEGMKTRRALASLRTLDPQGAYDYNHIYLESGVVEPASPVVANFGSAKETGSFRVGLVDEGVDASHPVFKATAVHQYGCNGNSVPTAHGTSVASLLVGKAEPFTGAAPGAELFAADVYCGLATGGAVDAVVDAIAWLARQHIGVLNVSLVGPKNLLLENVVRLVIARGHIIVAAVGNDGPAAPPLYPAAYPDVIGVTGVDAHRKVLLEACRGYQVKFAAPGADMAAAGLASSFVAVRGTSFAAPIVAGLLASALHEPDRAAATMAIQALANQAIDLGTRGIDKTYGAGLVGEFVRSPASLALVTASGTLRGN